MCSSDFITQQWLSVLSDSTGVAMISDWHNTIFSQFQLLSKLCQFADQIVNDTIRRFLVGSFVTSNALTKIEFDRQINTILDEFFQSTILYFGLFVQTTRLLRQIDQPSMGSIYGSYPQSDPSLFLTHIREQNSLSITQVCHPHNDMYFFSTANIRIVSSSSLSFMR